MKSSHQSTLTPTSIKFSQLTYRLPCWSRALRALSQYSEGLPPDRDTFELVLTFRDGRESRIFCRPRTTDASVAMKMFCKEMRFASYLKMRLSDHSALLDLGGNIGISTIILASFFPLSSITVVEPNPATFKVLLKNTEYLGKQVTAVEAAVAAGHPNTNSTAYLFGAGANAVGFSIHSRNISNAEKHLVRLRTLSDLSNGANFSFVKVDVEGSEKNLLEDQRSLEILCRATCMAIETHDRIVPGCSAALRTFPKKCSPEQRYVRFRQGEYDVICKR